MTGSYDRCWCPLCWVCVPIFGRVMLWVRGRDIPVPVPLRCLERVDKSQLTQHKIREPKPSQHPSQSHYPHLTPSHTLHPTMPAMTPSLKHWTCPCFCMHRHPATKPPSQLTHCCQSICPDRHTAIGQPHSQSLPCPQPSATSWHHNQHSAPVLLQAREIKFHDNNQVLNTVFISFLCDRECFLSLNLNLGRNITWSLF